MAGALGAAVQAGILQGEVSDMMVMDQWQVRWVRLCRPLHLHTPLLRHATVVQTSRMLLMANVKLHTEPDPILQ